MFSSIKSGYLSRILIPGALAMSAATPAHAIVYEFVQTGGPGSTHGGHISVEVTEDLSTAANDVLFTFTNQLPILNNTNPPSISFMWFDTGAQTDLFSALSVLGGTVGGAYSGVTIVPKALSSHPFLPASFAPDYKFGLSNTYPYDRPIYGVNPGEYSTISATLGAGKSFGDVVNAMNMGINPTQATAGLRVGALVYFMNGTGLDDGGFVTNNVAAVPEPETWAMMLAGLGLVGLALRRRGA